MCFDSQCFLFVFILKMGLTGELVVHEIIRIVFRTSEYMYM